MPFFVSRKFFHITSSDRGDEFRFAELFSTYYSRLALFTFRYVHDRQLAEDIVQECFAGFWERRRTVPLQEISPSYLYAAVKRRALWWMRDKKTLFSLDENEKVIDDCANAHIIEAETYAELFRALSALPPKCRNIFELLYVHGKSYSEIAAELSISESTIRTQKAKGLRLLRQRLAWMIVFLFCWAS